MEGLQALALGGLAQSSLLLAGLVVYWVRPSAKFIGALAGFGAGALISAVAFDLIPESSYLGNWQLGLWFLIGAAIFVVSDRIVESKFGEGDDAGPLGIVVGSVVDGVPESIIFGIQIALGQVISAASSVPSGYPISPRRSLHPERLPRRDGAGRSSRVCGVWSFSRVRLRHGSAISPEWVSVRPETGPPHWQPVAS